MFMLFGVHPVRGATEPLARIGETALPVRVAAREVPLFVAPDKNAARRGTLSHGALAFVHARVRMSGCSSDWVLVGASAWACNLPGVFEARGHQERTPPATIAPVEFARIGARGALGYGSASKAELQLPDAELQPGFFVGIVEERTILGEIYGRTTHDVWIAKRDLLSIVPSDFEGVEIEDSSQGVLFATSGQNHDTLPRSPTTEKADSRPSLGSSLPHGWVYVEHATPRRSIHGAANSKARFRRLAHLHVLEVRRHSDHHDWYRVAEGWLSDRQLRVPSITPLPSDVKAAERWIDIERRTQTLVAYVGPTPVFATVVSTGRGPDQGPMATPVGLHRIWVKLASTDMDNLDEQADLAETANATEPYAVEAVPFVAFFLRGYGLHATYWHDAFGTPKSHGCVNLSLRDAARVFEFVSPKLAPGWQAVHPDRYDPGTLVRVR